MFRPILVVAAFSAAASTTSAFQASSFASSPTTNRQAVSLQLHNSKDTTSNSNNKNMFASLALAGSIFASTVGFSLAPPAALADTTVELSTGAVIVQTSTKQGQSLLKAEVDVKDLLGSIIKNRKALKASVGRVATVIQEELKAPVWAELTKEVLQFEGDVTPDLTVLPPRDIQQTLRDISKGKLNLIVNGEIINLSVDKSSTAERDEIVIRAKGVKGVAMPSFTEPAAFQARSGIQDQLDSVTQFWYTPLPASLQPAAGVELNRGDAIVGGSVLAVGGAYGLSYAYYISEQEAAAAKAEAQRKLVAERKRQGAAIAAKKKAEEEAKKAEDK